MIEPQKSSVRIVYLELDPAPQMPGEETFHAILDPAPSRRWKAAFTRSLKTGPELLHEASFSTFHRKVTLRFTVPEQHVTGAIESLKSQVLAVESRLAKLQAVHTLAASPVVRQRRLPIR